MEKGPVSAESQLKVPDLKAALLALKVPISDFAGLRKPALVQLLVHKRGGPATVSVGVDSSVDAKHVPRVARARRNRKAGSDEGEEEEAAEESNESESSISGEEADDGDLEPSQSSDLASGDTLSEAESDGASVGADAELPASDKAVNPKRQREESQDPRAGKSLKPSESVSATATKAAIEALAEQVLNGERCGGCRLVLRKHEKNFSCTSTKRRRGGGRGKYVCAHQFCTECINGPFRVMYAHDELGTTSSDYDFTPPKEWQCPSCKGCIYKKRAWEKNERVLYCQHCQSAFSATEAETKGYSNMFLLQNVYVITLYLMNKLDKFQLLY